MLRFFGLTPSDRETILEQIYFLVRRLGVSYTEARNMPIMYRQWFINRFVREHEEATSAQNRAVKDASSSYDRSNATLSRAFTR